jgi:hypothetical protein
MQRLVDSGALGGFPAGVPDDLVADGVIGGVPAAAREQPNGRFAGQSAIMGAQFVAQMGAEHDVAVLAAFAVLDMFWGYGAEVLDPDGYMNHLWDESTMRQMGGGATD